MATSVDYSVPAIAERCADMHGRGLWDATDAELLEAAWQFRRNFEAAEHFCRGWSGAAAANLVGHAEEAMRSFEKIELDASA